MFSTLILLTLIGYLNFMSTALIVIFSIIGVALIAVEGIVCGKITAELVRKKDVEINEVLWFWLGFMFSWIGILLTLVIKPNKEDK